jgi:hypothetical protein
VWSPLLGALLISLVPPPGELPVLARDVRPDGRIDSAEWAGAREVHAEGMRVRLGRRGDVLAVAVELDGPGICSLVLAAGDRAWVVHASAALGTGEYRCAGDGACTRTREFDFRCRDPSSSPAAEACRKEFRSAEGWIGSVSPSGTRSREFLVDLGRFGAGEAPLSLLVTGLVLPDKAGRWAGRERRRRLGEAAAGVPRGTNAVQPRELVADPALSRPPALSAS